MFVHFGNVLTFQIIAQNRKDLAYLSSEFPVSKETISGQPAFIIELVKFFDSDKKDYYNLDNGCFGIGRKALFHERSSMLIDDRYYIDFNDDILILKIPRNKISQRYMLLRIIYPLIRFYLLKQERLLLKGSCTASNGISNLFVGWSGAGKTTTILNDLANGRKYVSDTMSLITMNKKVQPLNNKIHVFWRNRKVLNETISQINLNKTEIQISLRLKRLFHILTLRQKSLSTILNIPEKSIEKNETILSKILILNPNGNIPHHNYSVSELYNIIFSINHYECCEFNKLLDILSYAGIYTFENYWFDFGIKLKKLIKSLLRMKNENCNAESALFSDVFACVEKSGCD